MKKLHFFSAFALVLTFFLNCQKNQITEEPIPVQSNDPNIGCTDNLAKNFKTTANIEDCSCQYDFLSKVSTKTPSQFTKKVLIEEHTGTWCGWCPLAKETMRKLTENQRVVGVEIHFNDEMAVMDKVFNPLKSKFGYPAFPSGKVNRRKSIAGSTFIMGEQEWKVNVDDLLSTTKIPSGLAIESKLNGKELEVLAHVAIKTPIEENYGIGIYLVEADVSGYPQMNYVSRDTRFIRYEAYHLPSKIYDIKHYNVTRDAISPIIGGFEVPREAMTKGKIFRKLFRTSIPNNVKKVENLHLVAFLMNQKDNQIVNVQQVAVGKTQDWD